MKKIILMAALAVFALTGMAQNTSVYRRTVVDANAQNPISGQTRNADTGEALPYVTVAIKGRGIGTISDREGRFEINGGKEGFSPADSIVFSHIGFDTEARTVGGLSGEGQTVALRQGTYEIEEVVVTNRESRLAKLGHSSSGTGRFRVGWFDNYYADSTETYRVNREGGVPIKIKHDSEILSFAMFIRQNGYERALMRLSFYSLEDNTPGEPIVHRDIRFEVKDCFKGWFHVDLAPYNIQLTGGREVLVTLSLLEDEMNNGTPEAFTLDGALLGKGIHYRKIGDDRWSRKGGFTMAMYLNARVYK